MGLEDKVLLISNSTVYGRGCLDHVESEIRKLSWRRATRIIFAVRPT